MVSGDLEVDGTTYFDGSTTLTTASTTQLTVSDYLWIGDDDTDNLDIRAGVWNLTSTATTTVAMTNGINFDSNTFVIDPNSNRVGIGTTAPGAKLEVIGGDVRLGGGATSYKTYFGTTAADEYYDAENRRLYFYGAANAYIGYYTTLSTLDLRANGGQRFLVGATERMRLGPSGGLSLGSTYVGTDPGAGSMMATSA
jgi:hypothetical protein